MRFCDLLTQYQPDTRAAGLGGKEWHKQIGRIHDSRSFIVNHDFDAIAGFSPMNRNCPASFERSIDRIVHQINEHLLDLRRIRSDSQLWAGNDLDFESRLEIHNALDQLAKIDMVFCGGGNLASRV